MRHFQFFRCWPQLVYSALAPRQFYRPWPQPVFSAKASAIFSSNATSTILFLGLCLFFRRLPQPSVFSAVASACFLGIGPLVGRGRRVGSGSKPICFFGTALRWFYRPWPPWPWAEASFIGRGLLASASIFGSSLTASIFSICLFACFNCFFGRLFYRLPCIKTQPNR